MGVLTVTLDKIMNLRDLDGIGKSDPYVVFEVKKEKFSPDKTFGKKESSKKANTCNPVYNETFTWHDINDLKNMRLHIRVWDEDIGMDDTIGHAVIDLDHAVLSSTPKEIITIVDKKLFHLNATIHLHISHQ